MLQPAANTIRSVGPENLTQLVNLLSEGVGSDARAEAYFNEVIDLFSGRYPNLMDQQAQLVKVIHVFRDKIPLLRVLTERKLLRGLILKKSSSDFQPVILQAMKKLAAEEEIPVDRAATTYPDIIIPILDKLAKGKPFVLQDHGFYIRPIAEVDKHFKDMLLGRTEHTVNGVERFVRDYIVSQKPYLSIAELPLKGVSDRVISGAIAVEANRVMRQVTGRSALEKSSRDSGVVVLVIGFGTVGSEVARYFLYNGRARVIVNDVSSEMMAGAAMEGFEVEPDLQVALRQAHLIVTCTDIVKGQEPLFRDEDFSRMQANAVLASATSADDEIDLPGLKARKVLVALGDLSGDNRVYRTAQGTHVNLVMDGRPANVGLADGGAGDEIYYVEGAALAGAFRVAECAAVSSKQGYEPQELDDDDRELVARLWLKHFRGVGFRAV